MKYLFIFLSLTFLLYTKRVDSVMIPISFVGNDLVSTSDLEDVVGAVKPPAYAVWKKSTAKINSILLPKLDKTFKLFYKNEGLYDANITHKLDLKGVTVFIQEQRPIIIDDIVVKSDLEISEAINLKKYHRFRAKDFSEMKSNIRKKLLSQGYCSPELSTKAYLTLKNHSAIIKIDLEKRKVCHFGKITIDTKSKTMRDDIILSRLHFEEGDVFDITKIQDSYQSLYSLEAFDQLNLDYSRNLYNKKPVNIKFAEVRKHIHTRMGVGYATDLKFQAKYHWEYKNYKGNGKKLIFNTLWSEKQKLVENVFFIPYLASIFDYHLDFQNSVGYIDEASLHEFDEKVFYDRFYFSHSSSEWYNSIGLGVENREIFNSDILNETFFLIYPFMKVVYDKRNSKLNPTEGYYFSHEMEYGLPYSPDSTSYLKYIEELRLIHSINNVTFSSVGRIGAIEVYSNDMPESKKFFAGGAFSNRAYGYDRLGIVNSSVDADTRGGLTLANLSLEANFPIYKNFRGAVFSDSTMITENEGLWKFSNNIIYSAGLGFRYLTPIGPFKIDFGMNVKDSSQRAVHFQVGQSF